MPNIPIEKLLDNPYQPRQTYSDIDIFAANILDRKQDLPDTLGLIHTPNGRLVELNSAGDVVILPPDQYPPQSEQWAVQLAEGHRRRRAFEYLAVDDPDYLQMPVNLLELSDQAMDNIAWDENAKRANINPVEEAAALARTMEDFNLTQQQLADLRGLGRSTVANKLRLLKLPDDMLAAIKAGQIPEKTGIAFLPALDIKPHQMEQAHPKLITDPNQVVFYNYGGPCTPNALRKRILATDYVPTASEVRSMVEKITDACTPWPCEHCGINCKTVQFITDNGPDYSHRYCRNCWENEVTELLYCPGCHIRSLVRKSDIEQNNPQSCTMCGETHPAADWPDKYTQIAMPDQSQPEPPKQPQALGNLLEDKAVYPCHNCGERTIQIYPDDDFVECDTCKEHWDSIEKYHKERARRLDFGIADNAEPETPAPALPTDDQRHDLASLIISTDGWQQVVTEQFACQGYTCKELFYDPAGIRAWKNNNGDYLCTTCYVGATLNGKCPTCGHTCDIPATTYKNNFGWRCEKCGKPSPATAWVAVAAGNIDIPEDTATPNGNGHNPNESHIAAPNGTAANDNSREILQNHLNARFLDITMVATIEQLREINTVLDQLALNHTRAIRIA